MKTARLLTAIFALSWLGACTSVPDLTDQEQALQLDGNAPQNWHARGRFAFRAEETRSGQFDWQQNGSDYSIRLFGSFGLGSVRIEGTASTAEIISGEDRWITDTPELTLFQITGVSLPLAELSNWMTGRISADQNQRWQVAYSDIQQIADYQLPGRIDLQTDQQTLSILVTDWDLPDA